jgi:hypothetical protein
VLLDSRVTELLESYHGSRCPSHGQSALSNSDPPVSPLDATPWTCEKIIDVHPSREIWIMGLVAFAALFIVASPECAVWLKVSECSLSKSSIVVAGLERMLILDDKML